MESVTNASVPATPTRARPQCMARLSHIVAGLAMCLAASSAAFAQAEKYPSAPIRLIVPFVAGGATDIVARILGESLARKLGQPVVIDNRGGAGGAIGAEAVAAARPDGYTLGMVTISTQVVNPACNRDLKYHPINSFTPIAQVAEMPNLLVVRSDLRIANFAEFREAVKVKTAKFNLGTAGNCSFAHLVLEHLNHELGASINHVPYRGSAPALTDLVGGSIDLMGDIIPLLSPHIASGKIKPLAIAAPKRVAGLADVPTFDELKLPAVGLASWYGIVAPANLPKDRLALISDKIQESLSDAEVQERFAKASTTPVLGSTPDRFRAFLSEQFEKESAFVRDRKMSAN